VGCFPGDYKHSLNVTRKLAGNQCHGLSVTRINDFLSVKCPYFCGTPTPALKNRGLRLQAQISDSDSTVRTPDQRAFGRQQWRHGTLSACELFDDPTLKRLRQ